MERWKNNASISETSPLKRFAEPLSLVYMNTLESEGIYKIWRQNTQWKPERLTTPDKGSQELEAVIPIMVAIDQGLAHLEPMPECVAFRFVPFQYPDFADRFFPGRDDLTWFEPKSCAAGLGAERVVQKFYNFYGCQPGTVFKIHGFKGHDISFLSEFPEEMEAMCRGLQKFRVRSVTRQCDQPKDSKFPFADLVELDFLELSRRKPIQAFELRPEELLKYQQHVSTMRRIQQFFNEHFTFKHLKLTNVSQKDADAQMKRMDIFDGMPLPLCEACYVDAGSGANHKQGKVANFTAKIGLYSKTALGNFDIIVMSATQSASFDKEKFEEILHAETEKYSKELWKSSGLQWLYYRYIAKEDHFKESAQGICERMKKMEEDTVFQDVLRGYCLDQMMTRKLIKLEDDNIRILK